MGPGGCDSWIVTIKRYSARDAELRGAARRGEEERPRGDGRGGRGGGRGRADRGCPGTGRAGRRHHPRRAAHPARVPRAAHRGGGVPIATRRSSCTAPAAPARRSRRAAWPSSATPTCARWPAASRRGRRAGLHRVGDRRRRCAGDQRGALLAAHAAARGRRSPARSSCSSPRCCASAPAASARRRACTSPRPASARSADRRRRRRRVATCSARSSTPPSASACPRSRAPSCTLRGLNPDVKVDKHRTRITADNAIELIVAGYDVIVDGADNFATRYLVNDVALRLGKPVIHASIFRFEGQLTVFPADRQPLLPLPVPGAAAAEEAPSCAEAGVLGVLPGVMGVLQATEAIKLAARPRRDARRPAARLRRPAGRSSASSSCAAIRSARPAATASIASTIPLIDYEQFCAGPTVEQLTRRSTSLDLLHSRRPDRRRPDDRQLPHPASRSGRAGWVRSISPSTR